MLCALSGGVDSSVTALLVRRAIGERLTCIFVDNGLLRADEAEEWSNASGRSLAIASCALMPATASCTN